MNEKYGKGYFKRGVNNQWLTVGRLMAGRVSPRMLGPDAIRPTYSSIVVTHNCNYKCVMCSFWYNRTENELTADEIEVLVHDLREIGVAQVNFTGGEPLLRKDLAEIVARAAKYNLKMIQITTNGSLAKRERLEELISAGARRFAVSCDGVGEHHDTQRGVPGAWKKNIAALDALRAIRSEKVPKLEIELPIVISKTTLGDLGDVLRLCEEYRAVLHLQFLDSVQYFSAAADCHDQALTRDELDHVIDEVHGYIERAKGIDPLMTHEGMEYIRHYMKREDRAGAPQPACGVGYTLVYIDALGNVFPGCFAMAPIGNVREKPLREIVGSKHHGVVADDMFRMNCPGCPNGYAWQVFINPRSLVNEAVDRVRRRLKLVAS